MDSVSREIEQIQSDMRKEWVVRPATGAGLEPTLNRLEKEGWDIWNIFEHGVMQQENKLMQNQATLMPLFTVIAYRWKESN